MKIGVRSVFSGVVGGTAGAVSKITGGFGKVLAKMTYDEEFQRKRIEGIKKRKNQAWPLHSALFVQILGRPAQLVRLYSGFLYFFVSGRR